MHALHIIQDEHRNLWRIALTLEQVIDDLHGSPRSELAFFYAVFDYFDQFVDQAHHAKEDRHLFCRLRQRTELANATLDQLESEHRHAPARLAQLRQLLADCLHGQASLDTLTTALRQYTHDLKAHIRTEEQQVFPLASQWLTDQLHLGQARGDLAAMAQAISAWRRGDIPRVTELNAWVLQTRESSEFRAQTEQMGRSLLDWLRNHHTASAAGIIKVAATSSVGHSAWPRLPIPHSDSWRSWASAWPSGVLSRRLGNTRALSA